MIFGRRFYILQLAFYAFFLIALTCYVLTSPSPMDDLGRFVCTDLTTKEVNMSSIGGNKTETEGGSQSGWVWNDTFRVLVLLLFAIRLILFFFINGEFSSIWTKLREVSWRQPLAIFKSLPLVFIFDLIVYLLSFYITVSHPSRLNSGTAVVVVIVVVVVVVVIGRGQPLANDHP